MIIEVSRNMCSVYAVALMYCLSLDEPMGSTGSGTMNRQAFRISPIGVVLPDIRDTVNVQTKESMPRLRFFKRHAEAPKGVRLLTPLDLLLVAPCRPLGRRLRRCRRNPRDRQSHTRLPPTAYPALGSDPYQYGSIRNALLASSS